MPLPVITKATLGGPSSTVITATTAPRDDLSVTLNGSTALTIVDWSSPTSPVNKTPFSHSAGLAGYIATIDPNTVFVGSTGTASTPNISLIDVTDPDAFVLLQSYEPPGATYTTGACAVGSSLLFLAAARLVNGFVSPVDVADFYLIDISDRTNLSVLDTYNPTSTQPTNVGLTDILGGEQPVHLGDGIVCVPGAGVTSIVGGTDYYYSAGLDLFDVSGGTITRVGFYQVGLYPNHETYAAPILLDPGVLRVIATVAGVSELLTLDISDPSNITEISRDSTLGPTIIDQYIWRGFPCVVNGAVNSRTLRLYDVDGTLLDSWGDLNGDEGMDILSGPASDIADFHGFRAQNSTTNGGSLGIHRFELGDYYPDEGVLGWTDPRSPMGGPTSAGGVYGYCCERPADPDPCLGALPDGIQVDFISVSDDGIKAQLITLTADGTIAGTVTSTGGSPHYPGVLAADADTVVLSGTGTSTLDITGTVPVVAANGAMGGVRGMFTRHNGGAAGFVDDTGVAHTASGLFNGGVQGSVTIPTNGATAERTSTVPQLDTFAFLATPITTIGARLNHTQSASMGTDAIAFTTNLLQTYLLVGNGRCTRVAGTADATHPNLSYTRAQTEGDGESVDFVSVATTEYFSFKLGAMSGLPLAILLATTAKGSAAGAFTGLSARIISRSKVLAALDAGGTHQTVITDVGTTFCRSVIDFTYVNPTIVQADLDDAVVEYTWTRSGAAGTTLSFDWVSTANINTPWAPTTDPDLDGAVFLAALSDTEVVVRGRTGPGTERVTIVNAYTAEVLGKLENSNLGVNSPSGVALRFEMYGEYAVLPLGGVGSGDDVQIVNCTNRAAPTLAGRYASASTSGAARHLQVVGSSAYVNINGYFTILDISNPNANPLPLLGNYFLNPQTDFFDFTVYAGYVVGPRSTMQDSLTVLDVSNPAAMTVAGYVAGGVATSNGWTTSVVQYSNYVYVLRDAALMTWDMSTPTAPVLVNTLTFAIDSRVFGLRRGIVIGTEIFVADGNTSQLIVFSLANPAAPIVDRVITGATITGVTTDIVHLAAEGQLAFVMPSVDTVGVVAV